MATSITTAAAKRNITKAVGEYIKSYVKPQTHFTSFFGSEISEREMLAWEKSEFTEGIASATVRNSDGNLNTFSNSFETITSSPEFHEKFVINQLLSSIIGPGEPETISSKTYGMLLESVTEKTQFLADKIYRAIELASAQFFNTGTMSFKNNDLLDFQRPSGSMVDFGAGEYFSDVACDVRQKVLDMTNYFRDQAFWTGTEFSWTLSPKAMANLQATTWAKDNYNRYYDPEIKKLNNINPDQQTAQYAYTIDINGTSLHVFIYNGKGLGAQGGSGLEMYLPENKSVFVPWGKTIGNIVNFPIDALVDDMPTRVTTPNGFYAWRHIDTRNSTVEQHIKAAKLPVPKFNKLAYTAQVLA